jgi:hypothetical protein
MRLKTVAGLAIGMLAFTTAACINATAPPSVAVGVARPANGKTPFASNIDPATFAGSSANVTNKYFPLKPGTEWTWEGHALDGQDYIRRRIILTVTDLTKEVAGVQTVVLWERDFDNDKLIENELFFVAQDKAGNVWHLGESVETYDEEGSIDGAQSWLVGYLEGAKAGILVPARPNIKLKPWSEGFAPAPFNWGDVARISKAGAKDCVRAGCYSDVIVIEESEPLKPDAYQLKSYAKGVGNIRTDWAGKRELDKEELELVKKRVVSSAEQAQARQEALNIDARQRVYGLTGPLLAPAAKPAS